MTNNYGLRIEFCRWCLQQIAGVAVCFTLFYAIFLEGHVFGQNASPQKTPSPGEVNLEFSRVYIFVDKTGVVGHQHAVEGKLKSGVLFAKADTSNMEQNGSIVFDMKSFDADTPNARKYLALEGSTDEATRKKVNENMLGIEILSVNKYPEARFSNVKLVATGKQSKRNLPEYLLEGDFKLHEVTKRIQIRCDLEMQDGWQHVRGGFRILQSEYGIKPFSKMMGAVGVKDELLILGDLWVAPAP